MSKRSKRRRATVTPGARPAASPLREAENVRGISRSEYQTATLQGLLERGRRLADLQPAPATTVGLQVKRKHSPLHVVSQVSAPGRMRRRSMRAAYNARIINRATARPSRVEFARSPSVCSRRKSRREVLFAKGRGGGGKRKPRWSLNSFVRC